MITYVVGDLFQSPAKVLVNAVNMVGVMGKGISAEFKAHYPEMFAQYETHCRNGDLTPGRLFLYKTPHKWIVNFPTKQHWRSAARLETIEAGLQKFVGTYADQGFTSVSFPMLGTGSGGLNWENEVRPLMEAYLGSLPLMVYIHRYDVQDPFIKERAYPRTARTWLHNRPLFIGFFKFWRDLARVVKQREQFTTFGVQRNFRAVIEDGKRRSLTLYPADGASVFIPETMLADLWLYLHRAGYCAPHNLLGGLDQHTDYLFALFSEVAYVRPVLLSWDDRTRFTGLHIVPPPDKTGPAHSAAL